MARSRSEPRRRPNPPLHPSGLSSSDSSSSAACYSKPSLECSSERSLFNILQSSRPHGRGASLTVKGAGGQGMAADCRVLKAARQKTGSRGVDGLKKVTLGVKQHVHSDHVNTSYGFVDRMIFFLLFKMHV